MPWLPIIFCQFSPQQRNFRDKIPNSHTFGMVRMDWCTPSKRVFFWKWGLVLLNSFCSKSKQAKWLFSKYIPQRRKKEKDFWLWYQYHTNVFCLWSNVWMKSWFCGTFGIPIYHVTRICWKMKWNKIKWMSVA